MKNYALVLLLITGYVKLHAQTIPAIEWQKSLGGTDNERAFSIQPTNDNGLVIAGYTASEDGDVTTHYGGRDFWIVKLDAAGDMLWQKAFGGTQDEEARSIQQTTDSGFIVAGFTASNDSNVTGNHGGTDYWIVKLDIAGNLEWQRSLGGTKNDTACSIQQTNNGGFIVAGTSHSNDGDVTYHHGSVFSPDIWLAKLDASGNITKEKSFGGTGNDHGRSIRQTSDNGFILVGFSDSENGDVTGNYYSRDYWIVKLTIAIKIEWEKCLGGYATDEGQSVEETDDGGFIVTGSSDSNDGDVSGNHFTSWYGSIINSRDIWTVRLTKTGNILWQKSLGGTFGEHAFSTKQTIDKGFIVAGISFSNGWDVSGNKGNGDAWIVKLDSSGAITWQQTIGGTGSDIISSIIETTEEEIIAVGSSGSNDGDVSGNHGLEDYWIVKLSCNVPQIFFEDADGDGFGNVDVSITVTSCIPPLGYVSDTLDCNDAAAAIHPPASPSLLWQKCLGGTQFNGDFAAGIEQTSDGGYIMAGSTWSDDGDVSGNKGESDYWVVKLGAEGMIEWQKCLGGSSNEYARSVQQTTDGGYVVAGESYSTDGDVSGHHGTASNSDIWMVKLDASGNIQWEKSLGGSEYEQDGYVKQTPDGGYIVVGTSGSNDGDVSGHHGQVYYPDLWVVRLNAVGTILWQKSLGGYESEYGKSVSLVADGSYVVAGQTASNNGNVSGNHGYWDSWVVNLDSSGNMLWQKCLGGSDADALTCIRQTTDGGFIALGNTTSTNGDVSGNHGYLDYWIVKLDPYGNLLWQKCLGESGYDNGFAMCLTAEGGFIVAGFSESQEGDVQGHHGVYDTWIVKLSSSGNVEWIERCMGGEGIDAPASIDQTDDGGFIVAGFSDSQLGDVTGNHGFSFDCWVVRLAPASGTEILNGIDDDCDGTIDGIIDSAPLVEQVESPIFVYPNPTNGIVTIAEFSSPKQSIIIRVLDFSGKELYLENIGNITGTFSKQLDLSNFSQGTYLLELIHNGQREVKKLVIQK